MSASGWGSSGAPSPGARADPAQRAGRRGLRGPARRQHVSGPHDAVPPGPCRGPGPARGDGRARGGRRRHPGGRGHDPRGGRRPAPRALRRTRPRRRRRGRVRASAGLGSDPLARTDTAAAVDAALRNQPAAVPEALWPWSRDPVLLWRPVGTGADADGAVVLRADPALAAHDVARAWGLTAAGAVLASLLAAGLALLLARWLLRPVQALADGVRDVMAGRDVRLLPETGPRELRALERSFLTMADTVAATAERQRHLVAEAAHQIRNPLAALQLRVDALDPHVGGGGRAGYEGALAEVDRLTEILDGDARARRRRGVRGRLRRTGARGVVRPAGGLRRPGRGVGAARASRRPGAHGTGGGHGDGGGGAVAGGGARPGPRRAPRQRPAARRDGRPGVAGRGGRRRPRRGRRRRARHPRRRSTGCPAAVLERSRRDRTGAGHRRPARARTRGRALAADVAGRGSAVRVVLPGRAR